MVLKSLMKSFLSTSDACLGMLLQPIYRMRLCAEGQLASIDEMLTVKSDTTAPGKQCFCAVSPDFPDDSGIVGPAETLRGWGP